MWNKIEISPWEKRHGECFAGPRIPFGSMIQYFPTEAPARKKDAAKFDVPLKRGVFLGYKLLPGAVWKKEYIVADLESFTNLNFITLTDNEGKSLFRKLKVHTTLEVVYDFESEIQFPLKSESENQFSLINGKSSVVNFHFDDLAGNTVIRSDHKLTESDKVGGDSDAHVSGGTSDTQDIQDAKSIDALFAPESAVDETKDDEHLIAEALKFQGGIKHSRSCSSV